MKDEVEEKAESIYEKIQVDGVIRSEAYVVRIVVDALKGARDAAFVRGLERAKGIAYDYENMSWRECQAHYGYRILYEAIQAEIDKVKAGK